MAMHLNESPGDLDPLLEEAAKIVIECDHVSVSLLQRRLGIGYAKAARLIGQLEYLGAIESNGSPNPRKILIKSFDELKDKIGILKPEKQKEAFQVFAGYKAPDHLRLRKSDKPLWDYQLSDLLATKEYRENKWAFPTPLGYQDEKPFLESLTDVNSLIVSGNPSSGKENLIDGILVSFLLHKGPSELRFILNDPTEYLALYDGIPHLLARVIVDPERITSGLMWAKVEMDKRLHLFADAGVRELGPYNDLADSPFPRILIVTFLETPEPATFHLLTRLTGSGLRTGIYNIIVTDRTNEKNLPNDIKSNVGARAVFRMTSVIDSRAIGVEGAESLGSGEILYRGNFRDQIKLKAVFTSEENVKEVVEAIKLASDEAQQNQPK
jgi:DNA segregation ATPase FtsK/SpoIIIE-like protein